MQKSKKKLKVLDDYFASFKNKDGQAQNSETKMQQQLDAIRSDIDRIFSAQDNTALQMQALKLEVHDPKLNEKKM